MNILKPVLSALFIALVLKLFVFDIIIAQGDSMEPAIKNGSVLIISRLRYGLKLSWKADYLIRWAEPKAGDVLVFYSPAGELSVKRCAATPEYNSFYAEGDNSLASYDSRSYGPVPVDNVIGKVLGH